MSHRRSFLKSLLAGALGFLGLSRAKALDPKKEFQRIKFKYPIYKQAVLESVEIHPTYFDQQAVLYQRTDFCVRCDVYEYTDDPKKMTKPEWPAVLQVRPGWKRLSSEFHYSPDKTVITGHYIDAEV